MSGGKRRSGFQITSVTSDQTSASQSASSMVLTVIQSETSSSCSPQGSSSQPTTPSLWRKYISHDAPVQGAGSSSRFRVVRLAVGGAGSSGRGEPYHRGRWTCMDFLERQEGVGFRRVMDSMRQAHSLESLEMVGRDRGHSQDTPQLLGQPVRSSEGAGLVLRSGPPSPTHQEPINIRLLDRKQPMRAECLDYMPPAPSPRPQNAPPPLRLDVDEAGRSVLRQSLSQPGSPPPGSYHPAQTPAAFSLDQTIFNLPGDDSSSSNSLVAIDNKIEQAMDLVKSHLMLAVREEVELLREQIRELQEKNQQLERENHILRTLTHNKHTT